MKTNSTLRTAFGVTLFCFFLPFAKISVSLVGGVTLNGWNLAFGSNLPGIGSMPPDGPTALCLIVLLVGFLLTLVKKKPIGRWIGILPLITVLKFASIFGADQNNIVFSMKFLFGAYLVFWLSLALAIIGFRGREEPAKS
jgi:hypothetical protein